MSNMWLLFEGFWLNGQLLGRIAVFSQIDRAKKSSKNKTSNGTFFLVIRISPTNEVCIYRNSIDE